jgi:hypothetical protein
MHVSVSGSILVYATTIMLLSTGNCRDALVLVCEPLAYRTVTSRHSHCRDSEMCSVSGVFLRILAVPSQDDILGTIFDIFPSSSYDS